MKLNQDKLREFISCIFSFFLFLLFLLLFLLFGLYAGVFNKKVVESKVNESNFYNETYSLVYSRAKEVAEDAGLPEEVFREVITLERVYVGGKYYAEDVLDGKEPVFQTQKLEKELEDNINRYLSEKNIKATAELKAGTRELVQRILQEYQRGIQFDFIRSVGRLRKAYIRVLEGALPAIYLLLLLIILFLFKIQRYPHRMLRYINYGLLGASLLTAAVAAGMLLMKVYGRLPVEDGYYKNFLIRYFYWDIRVFLYLAGMGVILSAALGMLTRHLKYHVKNNRRIWREKNNEENSKEE